MTTYSITLTLDDSERIAVEALIDVFMKHGDLDIFKQNSPYRPVKGAVEALKTKIKSAEMIQMSSYTP